MGLRLLFSPGFLTLSRYISKKLGLARRKELRPDHFNPDPTHEEEFRVKQNRDLWLASRPTSFSAVCRMYKKDFLPSFLVGCLQWALQLFGAFFFFQALANILSDPTQQNWFGWVIISTMFVCLCSANLFQAHTGSMNVMMGAKMKAGNFWRDFFLLFSGLNKCAGLNSLVYRVSQSLKNPEDVGVINTLISNDADRVFAAGQFFVWAFTSVLMVIASLALTLVLAGWAAVPGVFITVRKTEAKRKI